MTATQTGPRVEDHPVVIIGAGPAGLATAGALHGQGVPALVVDRSDDLGARIGPRGAEPPAAAPGPTVGERKEALR